MISLKLLDIMNFSQTFTFTASTELTDPDLEPETKGRSNQHQPQTGLSLIFRIPHTQQCNSMPMVTLGTRNNLLQSTFPNNAPFDSIYAPSPPITLAHDRNDRYMTAATRLTTLIRKFDMFLNIRLTDCRSVHLNTPLKVPNAQ